MEKDKKSWFKELYPEVAPEYPPDLKIDNSKPHKITFEEDRPRIVVGGFGKKTAVINVKYNGEKRSLYVGSNVDLARQINNLWINKEQCLKGITVIITRTHKKGRNWVYEVKAASDNPVKTEVGPKIKVHRIGKDS